MKAEREVANEEEAIFLLVPCSERKKNTGTAIQIVQTGSEHPVLCVCVSVCEKAAERVRWRACAASWRVCTAGICFVFAARVCLRRARR